MENYSLMLEEKYAKASLPISVLYPPDHMLSPFSMTGNSSTSLLNTPPATWMTMAVAAAVCANAYAFFDAYGSGETGMQGYSRLPYQTDRTNQTAEIFITPSLDERITATLHSLYRTLANKQVDLDPDMRKILSDNLWNLY